MREVSLNAFAAAHAGGAIVIDVREPYEYTEGHVPGARLVPMGRLTQARSELPRTERVYLICGSGNRSLAAADFLAQAGIQALSVAGGTAPPEALHPALFNDPGQPGTGVDAASPCGPARRPRDIRMQRRARSQRPTHPAELPTDRPVVAVCQSGLRSARAARLLTKHGHEVYNLRGGMRA